MNQLNFIHLPEVALANGLKIPVNLSYQVFGDLKSTNPVVLVIHALTGNSNVCGENGWWNDLIGQRKIIDTNHYTVLAFNIPGNGYDGHTSNLIGNYKNFVAADVATIFDLGLKKLNIHHLFAIIGGSVGGGIAWELAARNPDLCDHFIPVACDWKSTDWVIANCHIQDAILNNSNAPLADARMHAMTMYRTPESFSYKFDRNQYENGLYHVESWLNHHGKKLTNRFQLSAYKLMNQLLKTIDITKTDADFLKVASRISANIHLVTINSDLLFKPEECWKTYVDLKSVKDNVSIFEIKSIHGHDAFLIEFDQLSKFLIPVFQPKQSLNEQHQRYTIRNW
jgi:homoserine O-acetyltransferase